MEGLSFWCFRKNNTFCSFKMYLSIIYKKCMSSAQFFNTHKLLANIIQINSNYLENYDN